MLHNLRSPHSRRAYAQSLRAFFAWVQTAPPDVTTRQMIAYRETLEADGKRAATVNRHLAAIRALYRAALDEGLITRNPAASVKTREAGREGSTPALTVDQVRTMVGALTGRRSEGLRDYALILLLVRTGLRREEVARVRVDDLHQEQGHWAIRVTRKGGGPQLVKVPADVYRALIAWLDAAALHEGALWRSLTRTGRGRAMVYQIGPALTTDGILKIVQQRARCGGVPILHLAARAARHVHHAGARRWCAAAQGAVCRRPCRPAHDRALPSFQAEPR